MSIESAAMAGRPRRLLQSIAAVLAGLVVIFVLSMGTDHIFHVTGVFPPYGQSMSTGLFLFALAYRCLFAVIGCFVTAWLAPSAPMRHALILGAIGVVLSTAGTVAMWDLGANWYPIALTLSSLPCAWAGGALHRQWGRPT